ncbi:MAG: hypothetical protein K0S61_4743, partial [Anaerocolumna sp.]|nr:hypothetical protein [Anaerocolumna sp.]
VNQSYQYDNAVDYYAGRVTGDILSMVGGSSSIVVEGVIGGTAQVTYGGMILSASAKNFGDDLNKLKSSYNNQGSINKVLSGASETTNGKGIAKNYEKSGGYNQTLRDFDSLNPSSVKDIQTQYGPGKVGRLSDGTTVVARPGSATGGPTLEISISNSKVYKIRY